MAAEHTTALTPADYINHHLTFFNHAVGNKGGFWSLNVDSLVVAIVLGVVGIGFFWWVARGATSGVPTKRQAFVELCFDFIDNQVKDVFHGDRHKFVAPLALTVGLWVLLMNAMDFLPADWMSGAASFLGAPHGFRFVPTADVNTTFALALSVWLLMIGFAIKVKGAGGFIHELFCSPFGTGPWWAAPIMFFFNFAFNLVEYISKPLSHSLRLFGNMYAGEIIFLLLWMLASAGLVASGFAVLLGLGWSIFHILIVALQAYIFMMLTIVYIDMAHQSH
jgi:F-type H+-transporting ATPase subunit a